MLRLDVENHRFDALKVTGLTSENIFERHDLQKAIIKGRYVGSEEIEDDGEPFEEKMNRLAGALQTQMQESQKLDHAIEANLKALGFWGSIEMIKK